MDSALQYLMRCWSGGLDACFQIVLTDMVEV